MYDLIGDIHGHAAELISLLELLGYERHGECYSHPARKAVFVGDFIDRGPQIREVLALVRPMVDYGSALAVMGNHEFNALCYHTPHPDRPGDFLRTHSVKNVHQHRHTLEQVPSEELGEYLKWFRELPMWLEFEGLRVVHASWDDRQIGVIRSGVDQHGGITSGFLQEASTVGSPLHLAIEDVLKGKEIRLPAGMSYVDKDGHERYAMRTKWYESAAQKTYCGYALTADPDLPDDPIQESVARLATPYPADAPPVFFGHYWLRAEAPAVLAPNVACLDYSVAKGGMLVAYRWDGEQQLSASRFAWVKMSTQETKKPSA